MDHPDRISGFPAGSQSSPFPPDSAADRLLDSLETGDDAAARHLLSALSASLEGTEAGDVPFEALNRPPDLFEAVLDHCAVGEYAAEWTRTNFFQDETFSACGTLVTAAASLNRAEHLRILLQHGWDPNSGSPASRGALKEWQTGLPVKRAENWNSVWPADTPYLSCVFRIFWNGVTWIHHCTPLAAAIFCSSGDCARLLWDWPGVRRTEDPSVCRAIALELDVTAGPDRETHFAADLPNATGTDLLGLCPDVVPERIPLHHFAWADAGHPEVLRAQLENGLCDPELRRLVRILDTDSPWHSRLFHAGDPGVSLLFPGVDPEEILELQDGEPGLSRDATLRPARLLCLVWERSPSAFQEPWAMGTPLRACVCRFRREGGDDPLVRDLCFAWRAACRGSGDLSRASRELTRLRSGEDLKRFLTELGTNTELWMDSCATVDGISPKNLRILLSRVRVRPVRPPGGQPGGDRSAVFSDDKVRGPAADPETRGRGRPAGRKSGVASGPGGVGPGVESAPGDPVHRPRSGPPRGGAGAGEGVRVFLIPLLRLLGGLSTPGDFSREFRPNRTRGKQTRQG